MDEGGAILKDQLPTMKGWCAAIGLLEKGYEITSQYAGMKITPIFAFIILDVGMFFLTSYIMHKKVNLK